MHLPIKYFNRCALFLVLPALCIFSCKKSFLEIVPKGTLVASTTSDYDLLLNNLDLFNIQVNPPVLMGDEIASVDTYFNMGSTQQQRLFRWDKDIYDVDQDAQEFTTAVKSLYTYNKVINEVMGSGGGAAAQKRSIRAEALAGRAWTNFMLINLYGKPYLASSAATDPGFPLITDAAVTTTKYTRASVQQVYDAIIQDLTTAIPDLPAVCSFRTRMCKAAGEGLLGKVYLFMGRFADALPLFNSAFQDLSGATVTIQLYDYNTTFATGGAFLPITSYGPQYPILPNNLESVYARQYGNNGAGTTNFALLKKETVELFTASDLRLKFFTSAIYPSGGQYPDSMLRRMGPSNVQAGIVLPDLYLLRAECQARLNDLTGARSDVEILRYKRMPAADAPVPALIAGDQEGLLRFILDERTREFALEGFRWQDMRRLSVDPLFAGAVATHPLFLAAGGTTLFTLTPERLTLRLPLKVIAANPGMPQNP